MTEEQEGATIADMERGLRYVHAMLSINKHVGQEGASYAQAAVELLLKKGIFTAEEFEERVAAHRQEWAKNPEVKLSKGPDKYTTEPVMIDCDTRVHLCKAACCTFRFFLTTQDLDERIVKWDYGNPYWIRQSPDGYCVHNDAETLACKIHTNRPYTCRFYDCRNDKRVWEDFEKRIPNPNLGQPVSQNTTASQAQGSDKESQEQHS